VPENVVPKVRVELTRSHPHRFLSSTLVVLPRHSQSQIVTFRNYNGRSISLPVPASTTLLLGVGRQNVGNNRYTIKGSSRIPNSGSKGVNPKYWLLGDS